MCRAWGVPADVYRDRPGIFAPIRPTGPLGDAGSQVGRAFAELGIAAVAAASAQAKGRIERLFGTCQDRLVSELRRAGASDLVSAGVVLDRFVPRFNARFAVAPTVDVPAWRPAPPARELERICACRRATAGRGVAGRRVEVELRLDGRLLVVDRGRPMLVMPVAPDPDALRDITLRAGSGPRPAAGGVERPGYAPSADHPWRRRTVAPPERRLTESPSS
jgi:hypothetical protein